MFKTAVFALIVASSLCAQNTVRFSSDATDVPSGAFAVGPFPSNVLTTPDSTQGTGLRVNLPPSEGSCSTGFGAVCSNNNSLNQLDGFSVNPRLMVCFSSLADVSTLGSGMFLVPVTGGPPITINQIIFDPVSRCAFAKPNNVLNQKSTYLLLVTDAIHDASGRPFAASPDFENCVTGSSEAYCVALAASLVGKAAPGGGHVIGASLFTTMTATGWLESARRFADAQIPLVLPAGLPFTFKLSQVKKMTWVPDRGGIGPQDIPLTALTNVTSVSFGLFMSPNYLQSAVINTASVLPLSYSSVSYHVFLPEKYSGRKIPVAIYGHGLGDSQFGAPTYIASTLAKNGIATLAIEFPGQGFGPAGRVSITGVDGSVHTVLAPGRGTPSPTGGTIGSTDGCIALGAIGIRDCGRQAAVDLAALVHAISVTGGLGLNLDPSRVYYVGQSFGATVGTLFGAVEPAVGTLVLNGAGGTSTDIARLTITGRPLALAFLQSVNDPLLFNVPAQGAPPEEYFHDAFNDNYVFASPNPVAVMNDVPGAMQVQAAFEAPDWLGMTGDPLAFAPHLATSPLSGVPPKKTLLQFGFGDLEVSNPTESAVVKAAAGQNATSFLLFETASALQPSLLWVEDPAVPGLCILSHRILSNPTIFTPGNEAELTLALAEQQQTADFFVSKGRKVTDPNQYLSAPFAPDDPLFETPIVSLPEALNFLQIPK